MLVKLASNVHVCVMTNTLNQNELLSLYSVLPQNSSDFLVEIYPFGNLPHPYLLTWMHKLIFKKFFPHEYGFTHFLYTEDDIQVLPFNIEYWLTAREILKPYGFFPSFFRIEYSQAISSWVSTDISKPVSISTTPRFEVFGTEYINMTNPYQGVALYDRDLLEEHLSSPSSDMIKYAEIELINGSDGYWSAREKATYGQMYINVKHGFYSRNVVPFFSRYLMLDNRSFIHHLPNNYANDPDHVFGKIKISELLKI